LSAVHQRELDALIEALGCDVRQRILPARDGGQSELSCNFLDVPNGINLMACA